MPEWFYRAGDASPDGRQGPVSPDELRDAVLAGRLTASDLVCRVGESDWVPARTLPGLFDDRGRPIGLAAQPAAAKPTSSRRPAKSSRTEPSRARSSRAKWHYVADGREAGPITPDELRELVRTGRLGPDSLVWKPGLRHWEPIVRIPNLLRKALTERAAAPRRERKRTDETERSDDRWVQSFRADDEYAAPAIAAPIRLTEADVVDERDESSADPACDDRSEHATLFEFGSFPRRAAAALVDALLLGLLIALPMMQARVGIAQLVAGRSDAMRAAALIGGDLLVWTLAALLYHGYSVASFASATPGKRLAGLIVADADGDGPGLLRAMIRAAVLTVVPGGLAIVCLMGPPLTGRTEPFRGLAIVSAGTFLMLYLVLPLVTPARQSLADLIAGTQVLRQGSAKPPARVEFDPSSGLRVPI